MPFAMTHLYIAYNILCDSPQINNLNEFMLGAIAPDAVHYRDNYDSDMKKESHLCVGEEKWGRITNNDQWQSNVLDFLRQNKESENADFIYGYCSHILTDIQNNIKIWTPFLSENREKLDKGYASQYHEESDKVDYELYLRNPRHNVIWDMLEKAHGYDINYIIKQDEVDRMKQELLHKNYKRRTNNEVADNRYVTVAGMEEFIYTESMYIKNVLFDS